MLPSVRVFIFLLISFSGLHEIAFCQPTGDSVNAQILPGTLRKDSIQPPAKTYQTTLNNLLAANRFISLAQRPVNFISTIKESNNKEFLFYLISSLMLMFGLFKLFNDRYFNNIFRVFFNTSLRQNQLTDLLLQARLPSLIFNISFIIASGLYIWLLLAGYYAGIETRKAKMLILCIFATGLVYIVKFCVLKLIGWITEMRTVLNTYIFVIFLINKIVGITLIPFIICLAFAPQAYFQSTVIFSLLVLVIFFIMRFLRSYSLLQNQLNLTRFHFLLYVVSLEILPLVILYKLSAQYLLKL